MPFKSKAQMKWAFANKMPWAQKWADMTVVKKLPNEVVKKKVIKRKKKKNG